MIKEEDERLKAGRTQDKMEVKEGEEESAGTAVAEEGPEAALKQKGDGGLSADAAASKERDGDRDPVGENGEEERGEKKKNRRSLFRPIIVITAVTLAVVLLSFGIVIYHAKVSGIFSEATLSLYESRRGGGEGDGRGWRGGALGVPGGSPPQQRVYEDFILYVHDKIGKGRIIHYDVALEFKEDTELDERDDHRLRAVIYRASRELASKKDLSSMPSRVMRLEIEKRIKEAVEAESVGEVYFTRFVVI